jgi:CTP-dependent riboflavin kinase
MNSSVIPSRVEIIKTLKENETEYQGHFIEFQSFFLSSIYKRYQSVESGHLVLCYSKTIHQNILRLKDSDLHHNISYEKFWSNHNQIKSSYVSIIDLARATSLPRETARRKIIELIKKKILTKKGKIISFTPDENYYNNFMPKEIEKITTIINLISKKLNLSLDSTLITKKIKKDYSFFWLHYLNAELNCLKIWKKKTNDLELMLIFIQCAAVRMSYFKKNKLIKFNSILDKNISDNELNKISVNASSVSELTNIPRETCSRKLEQLVNMKFISQNKISKRYYTDDALYGIHGTKGNKSEINDLFYDFYYIVIRNLLNE